MTQSISPEELAAIQGHFHDCIIGRSHNKELLEAMPNLATDLRADGKQSWYAVPGMYGGFNYSLTIIDNVWTLVTESASRIADGTGQRHHITRNGATLVEDGF